METFNEKTLHGFENLLIKNKLEKLNRSKPLQLWLKFFSKCFGINNIDLKNIVIAKRFPGASLILIPQELTLKECLRIFQQEGRNFETSILNMSEEIEFTRRKRGTYLFYHQKYGQLTLLEELIYLLFKFYKTGQLSILKTHEILSKHKNGTKIFLGFCKNPERKDYNLEIWY